MFWMTPKTETRSSGTPGKIMIMIDRSASISHRACGQIEQELAFIRQHFPQSQAHGFHKRTQPISHTIAGGCHPETGYEHLTDLSWEQIASLPCSLDISNALEYAALSNPCKTILFSDGGTVNKRRALQFADTISGDIDVFFCELSPHDFPKGGLLDYRKLLREADQGFMQELARRGGGKFFTCNPDQNTLRRDMERILRVRHFH